MHAIFCRYHWAWKSNETLFFLQYKLLYTQLFKQLMEMEHSQHHWIDVQNTSNDKLIPHENVLALCCHIPCWQGVKQNRLSACFCFSSDMVLNCTFKRIRTSWRRSDLFTQCKVLYQTRVTVFHRDIQTPRRELKIRGAAEYFWRASSCLEMRSQSWERRNKETKSP